MRPLFGFNKTTNEDAYSAKLVVNSLSGDLEKEYNEISQASYNLKKKTDNKIKRFGNYTLFASMVVIFIGVTPIIKYNISDVIKNDFWYFIIGGALLVLGIVLTIIGMKVKPSKVLQEQLKENNHAILEWEKKRNEFFKFPEDIQSIDVLVPYYTEVNGQIRDKNPLGINVNINVIIYSDKENIYLSDNLSVYSLPKEKIKDISLIDMNTPFMYWNKDHQINDELYAQYAIKRTSMSFYRTKSRVRVVMTFPEGEYYFDTLPVDYETIKNLL